MTSQNFMIPIGDDSPQRVFVTLENRGIYNNDFTEHYKPNENQFDYNIKVIPYTTFFNNGFIPELVCVQLYDATYRELQKFKSEVESNINKGVVTTPRESSDEYFTQQKSQRIILAIIISLITGITMIQIILQWLNLNRKQYYIFMICGASKLKIRCAIYIEWLILFFISSSLAIIIHALLLKPLGILGAGELSKIGDMTFVLGCYYCISLLATNSKIHDFLEFSKKEEL